MASWRAPSASKSVRGVAGSSSGKLRSSAPDPPPLSAEFKPRFFEELPQPSLSNSLDMRDEPAATVWEHGRIAAGNTPKKGHAMMMTETGHRAWLSDANTPNQILEDVLVEHTMKDWPLPEYLLEDLSDLAPVEHPTQSQVDAARIPLLNWFRQQREEQAAKRAGVVEDDHSSEDVLGPI